MPREEIKNDNLIIGRNAVIELLKSEREIENVLIAKGDREGSINRIISMCREKGIVVKNVDRKKLGEIVFNDKKKLEKLNSIVHPEVIMRCEALAKPLAVLDAPQLFESGADKKCYKIISVVADRDIRIDRIIKRDNITIEEARARVNAQLDEDYYIKNADYVIHNDGRDIKKQINNILEEIL